MRYIIYIRENNFFNIESDNFPDMTVSTFDSIDAAMEIFGTDKKIMMLIVEEHLDGIESLIEQLRGDEVYRYLPIIVLSNSEIYGTKAKYMMLGADAVFFYNNGLNSATKFDIIESGRLFINRYVKFQDASCQLRLTHEQNIKNSIQLEILHKLLSESVWKDSLEYAKGKIVISEKPCKVAVLFLEVDFTSVVTENGANAKAIIGQINKAFTIATQTIYENFGDVDKFIGNTLMAIYDLPDLAILSGMEILEKIRVYNESITDNKLSVRIGINYGRVIRGNVGLFKRSDKTIIGDTVNTAQRIKTVTDFYDILVSAKAINKSILHKLKLKSNEYKVKGKENKIQAVSLADNDDKKDKIYEFLNIVKNKYKQKHSLDKYYV